MKFSNMSVCDLRGYNSVEAASTIESVHNAALVILPKVSDDETRAAFAKIEMHNVASTVYCDMDAKINMYNGRVTLSDANLPDGESIYIVNGEAWVLPLSPEKHLSLIVNGKVQYDESSENNIQLLSVNGKAEPFDFRNTEILPSKSILSAEKFTGDGANKYYTEQVAVVQAVPPTAHGALKAQVILAHPSVRASQILLDAETVLYADAECEILFKADLSEFYLTETLLESFPGKLVLSDIGTVRIDKSVTPALLREKVLLLTDIGTVRATKATFDIVQLCCHDVGAIRKR